MVPPLFMPDEGLCRYTGGRCAVNSASATATTYYCNGCPYSGNATRDYRITLGHTASTLSLPKPVPKPKPKNQQLRDELKKLPHNRRSMRY